ncbi:MAG: hypothetical protein HUK28_04865 [Methanobrevibacter sp.]|nr:hypothetical protein [Methanobrevibacter sp.]
MRRNPMDLWLEDPDNKAKVFMWITYAMVIVTFMITIGIILFIAYLVGIF